jgi:hypothetical protein
MIHLLRIIGRASGHIDVSSGQGLQHLTHVEVEVLRLLVDEVCRRGDRRVFGV